MWVMRSARTVSVTAVTTRLPRKAMIVGSSPVGSDSNVVDERGPRYWRAPRATAVLPGRLDGEAGRVTVSLDSLPGPSGELPGGGGRSAHDVGDVVEGVLEHVVEDVRGALGGCEPGQEHVEGHAHLVVERDPVCGIRRRAGLRGGPVLGWRGAGRLTLPAGRPELVVAEPADHHHEPGPHVVELVEVDVHQPGVGLLHDILGLADAAEHPEGDVEEVAVMVAPSSPELHVDLWGPAGEGGAVHGFLQVRSTGDGVHTRGRTSESRCDMAPM